MTEQYTNFANVRVEDIPPCVTYRCMPHWGMSWRSPVKYKSLNGKMEFHYIHEWDLVTPYGANMIREEYFGDKVISSSYTVTSEGITGVNYSEGPAYWLKDGQVCKQEPKEEQTQQSSTDEKLDTLNAKLDELLAKFPGSYVLDTGPIEADNGGTPIQYFGATPDKENSVNQWEVKMADDKNPGRAIPFYIGDYLHAESLTGERVTVDGEEYLIMRDNLERRFRVTRKTQIVHLVDYVSITHYGPLIIGADWTVLYEDAIAHGEDGEKTFLPAGAMFKVLDYAGVFNGGEITPGTLAVRYAGYDYPAL